MQTIMPAGIKNMGAIKNIMSNQRVPIAGFKNGPVIKLYINEKTAKKSIIRNAYAAVFLVFQ